MAPSNKPALCLWIMTTMAIAVLPSSHLNAAPEPKEAKADKRLRQLQEERVKALEEQMQGQFERVKIGKDPLIQYLHAVEELAEARLEVADTQAKRREAIEVMVNELAETEELTIQLQRAGLQTKQGVAQVKAARLKAEIKLEKFKAEK